MGSAMLGAKLFFLCGLVFGLAAILMHSPAPPSFDIYVHATYFVLGPVAILWISARSVGSMPLYILRVCVGCIWKSGVY